MTEATTEPGFFSSLLGSVRTHIEDRIQSPFAGAFLLAWLAVNWKAVLLLGFSAASIEDRIEVVSISHLSVANVLWWPLLYAFVGVVCYYVVATVFLIAFELYGIGRRAVERRFDKHRWVQPESYIDFKQETRRQIDYYSALAADHVDKIKELTSDLARMEAEKKVIEAELESKDRDAGIERGKLEISAAAIKAAEAEVQNLKTTLRTESARLADSKNTLVAAHRTLASVASYLEESRTRSEATNQRGLAGLMRPNLTSVAADLVKDVDAAQQAIAHSLNR